jgi:hypothetical protein
MISWALKFCDFQFEFYKILKPFYLTIKIMFVGCDSQQRTIFPWAFFGRQQNGVCRVRLSATDFAMSLFWPMKKPKFALKNTRQSSNSNHFLKK